SSQLSSSPAAVGPPNNRQRITDRPNDGFAVANNSAQRASAFTLIEMIVVILIIATLAAMIMTGASSLIDRARKVQAKNDVTQIVNAMNAYYTKYGKYPMVDANQGTDTLYGKSGTAPGNEDLCNVLRALATG